MQRETKAILPLFFAGCALAFATCAASTDAQVSFGVTIGAPPPPMQYEAPPPMPGDGYVWMDGYWAPHGSRYAWMPGRWERPPYAGGYWEHPHWDHYQDGWHMHPGHWDREDHGGWDRGRGNPHGHDH